MNTDLIIATCRFFSARLSGAGAPYGRESSMSVVTTSSGLPSELYGRDIFSLFSLATDIVYRVSSGYAEMLVVVV